MPSFLNNSPSVVRNRTRSQYTIQRYSYETGESTVDIPQTVLSFYEYKRERGAPKSETLSSVVNWPVPLSYSEPNSLSYESYNLGMFGNSGSRIYNSLADSVKEGISLFEQGEYGQAWRLAQNMGLDFLATAPISRDTGIGRFLQLTQGVVANPHATVLFNGVPLRRFSFNWRFSPRSEAKAQKLLQQIQTIRERIYPEESDGGFALLYPNLVTVSFPNTKIPSVRKSFVENMTINNSSGNSIEFYRDGMPVDFEVNMSFVETEILTRNVLRNEQLTPYGTPEQVLGELSEPTAQQQAGPF